MNCCSLSPKVNLYASTGIKTVFDTFYRATLLQSAIYANIILSECPSVMSEHIVKLLQLGSAASSCQMSSRNYDRQSTMLNKLLDSAK